MEWWQIQDLMWTGAGVTAVLIAVGGVTLRFVVKPFLSDLARLRQGKQEESRTNSDRRLDRIEEQLESLSSSVERLVDVADFDRRLKAGDPPAGGKTSG